MEFEWDERKRRANLEKHGLDFLRVSSVFAGRHYTYPSPRGEQRWVTIGRMLDRLVAVVWTQRGSTTRIISVRRARHEEARAYRQIHE